LTAARNSARPALCSWALIRRELISALLDILVQLSSSRPFTTFCEQACPVATLLRDNLILAESRCSQLPVGRFSLSTRHPCASSAKRAGQVSSPYTKSPPAPFHVIDNSPTSPSVRISLVAALNRSSNRRMSEITEEGVSVVEKLELDRQPMPSTDAVYLISPTVRSVPTWRELEVVHQPNQQRTRLRSSRLSHALWRTFQKTLLRSQQPRRASRDPRRTPLCSKAAARYAR